MCLLLSPSLVSGKVLYVDSAAPATGNGSSWTNAFRHLRDALGAAVAGDEVRVAEGMYRPDRGTGTVAGDRGASFRLAAGVGVYGGFPCGGCPWTQRNPVAHKVILSGDLTGNDDPATDPCDLLADPNRAENSYHVVDCSGMSDGIVLDGLTITGGHAHGGSGDGSRLDGGGLYVRFGNLTIYNCRFIRNSAADNDGAGIYMDESCTVVRDNTIRANTAEDNGGAIHCRDSSPDIAGNTIEANRAADGPGVWCKDSSPAIVNNVIARNTATDEGGAICCREQCAPQIRNNTFVANVASAGGGIHCEQDSGQVVRNCILWANTSGNLHGCTAAYSCVQGGAEGIGNISLYPYFVDMAFGDYHLLSYSPCIDAGSSSVIPADEPDIDGDARVYFGAVDMGADEARMRSADTDDDDLPDHWERVYFKDNSANPQDDPDGDGATNLQEYRAGTYPAPGIETVYVSIANGADPQADGSREHPFSSVAGGIDASLANVLVAGGTYYESIVIDSRELHIRGGYASDFNEWDPVRYPTILDAQGRGTVVRYRSAPGGSLEGFTITGGRGDQQKDVVDSETQHGGGIHCSSSSPTIAYNHITANEAYDGAGIYCRGLAAPTIRNNFITNNIAEDDGGGVFCDEDFSLGSPEITNNTIVGNQAYGSGGGIYCKRPA